MKLLFVLLFLVSCHKAGDCVKTRYLTFSAYAEVLVEVDGDLYSTDYSIVDNRLFSNLYKYTLKDHVSNKLVECPSHFNYSDNKIRDWKATGEYNYLKKAGIIK